MAQGKFPLPASQLPQVQVDDATIQQWKAQALHTIDGIVRDRGSWYYRFDQLQPTYKPLYNKHGIRGYARVLPESTTIEYLCRGEFQMSMDDMVFGLHCETTAQQRAVYTQLYQSACLDGAILGMLQSHTPQDPFHSVSVKWLALTSPFKKLFARRDYIYFEYCCTTTDADGRRVLVEYKISPKLARHQLKDHALEVTRGSTHVISTYHMEHDTLVHLSMGLNDAASSMPSWLAMTMMPIMFERVLNHYGLVDARALLAAGVDPSKLMQRQSSESSLAPSRGTVSCRVCRKKFGVTRFRKWCRACGHAICKGCSTKVILFKNQLQIASRMPFVRERFCLRCVVRAREGRFKHKNAATNSFQSTSSSLISVKESTVVEVDAADSSSRGLFAVDDLLNLEIKDDYDDLNMDGMESLVTPNPLAATAEEDDLETYARFARTESSTSSSSVQAEAEELTLMAQRVAHEASLLRAIHQERQKAGSLQRVSTTDSISSSNSSISIYELPADDADYGQPV